MRKELRQLCKRYNFIIVRSKKHFVLEYAGAIGVEGDRRITASKTPRSSNCYKIIENQMKKIKKVLDNI